MEGGLQNTPPGTHGQQAYMYPKAPLRLAFVALQSAAWLWLQYLGAPG